MGLASASSMQFLRRGNGARARRCRALHLRSCRHGSYVSARVLLYCVILCCLLLVHGATLRESDECSCSGVIPSAQGLGGKDRCAGRSLLGRCVARVAPKQCQSDRCAHSVLQGTRSAAPSLRESLSEVPVKSVSVVWYVSQRGSDGPTCGRSDGAGACATLGAVLSKGPSALNGSAVLVEPAAQPYECPAASVNASIAIRSSVSDEQVQFDCTGQGQFAQFVGADSNTRVELAGLSLHGCYSSTRGGCVQFDSVGEVRVANASFSSCRAYQGGGCVSIEYSTFRFGARVYFENIAVREGSGGVGGAAGAAGAVSVAFFAGAVESDVRFSGRLTCTDSMALGGNGGCVSVLFNGTSSDSSVVFEGQTTMANCSAAGRGGCLSVYFNGTSRNVSTSLGGSTSMSNCSALWGGCVSVVFSGSARRTAITFRNNTRLSQCSAAHLGGCVSVFYFNDSEESALAFLDRTVMTNCTAGAYGGCVSLFYYKRVANSSLTTSGSTRMSLCRSERDGGCVSLYAFGYATNSSVAFAGETTMFRCVSTQNGGCVSVLYFSDTLFTAVSFLGVTNMTRCSAEFGGCVALDYRDVSSGSSMEFRGKTTFSQCSAVFAGCVSQYYYSSAQGASLAFYESTSMSVCSSTSFGGCVSQFFRANARHSTLLFSGSTSMAHCTALREGGCVSVDYIGTASNTSVSFGGATAMSKCFAALGGCVYVLYNTDARSSSLVFQGETAMDGCSAGELGGCVFVQYGSSANTSTAFQGVTRMSDCRAGSAGGCVYVAYFNTTMDSALTFDGHTSMVDCQAVTWGGCIYYAVKGASMEGCAFAIRGTSTMTTCVAGRGGCLYVLHLSTRMRDVSTQFGSIVARNAVASLHGGAIACVFQSADARNVSAAFQNVLIENATALASQSFGGAISVQCTAGVVHASPSARSASAQWTQTCSTTFGSVYVSNARAAYGGGIDLQYGAHQMENVSLAHTAATIGGGGIRASGSASVRCSGCVLEGCLSETGLFSGIEMSSQAELALQDTHFSAGEEESSVLGVNSASGLALDNVSVTCASGYVYSEAATNFTLAMYPWVLYDRYCCIQHSYQAKCTACPKGTYALRGGSTVDPNVTCAAIPYGAAANSASGVAALPGYWGTLYPSPLTIAMYVCPSGYCCAGPESCSPYSYCSGNRAGILCGSCAEGFSQAYSSSECVPDSQCGQAYFYIVGAGFALGVAVYYVYVKTAESSGMSGALIGFYQLLPVLLVATSEERLWEQGIADVFNLRIPTRSNTGAGAAQAGEGLLDSVCPVVGLDAAGKLALHLFIPVLVAFMVGMLYILERKDVCKWRPRVQMHGRFGVACLLLVMLAYVTLLESTFSLLHCVPVMGEMRLFVSGDIKCYTGWQGVLFVVVVVLYGFPVLLWRSVQSGRGAAPLSKDYRAAIGTKYRRGCLHWEAVQLMKRVVFVSVYVFVIDVYVRLLVLCILSIGALFAHATAKPYRRPEAHKFEALLLVASCIIALINLRSAVYVTSATTPTGPAAAVSDHLRTLQFVLALLPAGVYIVHAVAKFKHERELRKRSRSSSLSIALIEQHREEQLPDALQDEQL